jgi:hypothetical protein
LKISVEGGKKTALLVADILITFAFNVCLLFAIRAIAKDTLSDKIYFAATRNTVFFGILLVLQLIACLPFKLTRNLNILAIILSLVLSLLNLALLFRCYAQICDASDVDMERKPSKFGFVNRYREEMETRRMRADEERERIKKERNEKARSRKKK